jgi:hypothetical protein
MGTPGRVEVRTYRGRSQADAAQRFGTDAEALAAHGLFPSMQMWTHPQLWRTFVTPVVLIVAGYLLLGIAGAAAGAAIGIGYVIAVRPTGTLSVTYTTAASTAPAWSAGEPVAPWATAPQPSASGSPAAADAPGGASPAAPTVLPVERPRPQGPRSKRPAAIAAAMAVLAVASVLALLLVGAGDRGRPVDGDGDSDGIAAAAASPRPLRATPEPGFVAAVAARRTTYAEFLAHVDAASDAAGRLLSGVPSDAKAMDRWARKVRDRAATELDLLGSMRPDPCYAAGLDAWRAFWEVASETGSSWDGRRPQAGPDAGRRLEVLLARARDLLAGDCVRVETR